MPGLVGKATGDSGNAKITAMEANEPYVGLLNVTDFISIGSSNYHAFLARVQKSTSYGLQFGANYTWSKATGNVGNAGTQTFAESQQGNSSGPTGGVDYNNINNNHSILDYDISNRFTLNGTYALPFGKGKWIAAPNRFVDALIGGWSTTAALTLQAGFPWGPSCAAQTNTAAGTLNGRCNRVAGQPLELPSSQQRYYNGVETLTLPDGRVITPPVNTYMKWNPDAWSTPTVALTQSNGTIKYAQDQYSLGSTPLAFGNMRTPGIQNLNLSVIKKFAITERYSFDLHVNATNALNHSNHQFQSNTGVTANNVVTPVTAAATATNTAVGQNSNTAFGSWGLTTLEGRQLVVQANFTF
jgi:hypothetical protein